MSGCVCPVGTLVGRIDFTLSGEEPLKAIKAASNVLEPNNPSSVNFEPITETTLGKEFNFICNSLTYHSVF